MIKSFKLYKESLLNKLEGPSDQEVIDILKKKYEKNGMLYKSVQDQFLPGIKYALEVRHADINSIRGYSLLTSVKFGNFEIVKYLVEKGADVNIEDVKSLYFAHENKHQEIYDYLVMNGANETDFKYNLMNGYYEYQGEDRDYEDEEDSEEETGEYKIN